MDAAREELFSQRVAAGSRTYFFDVKVSTEGVRYLIISESWRDEPGEFQHSRVMVFEEHLPDFYEALAEAVRLIIPKEKAYSVEKMRRTHANAYAKWTDEETELLRLGYASGETDEELAQKLGRQPSAIRSRLQRLGLR